LTGLASALSAADRVRGDPGPSDEAAMPTMAVAMRLSQAILFRRRTRKRRPGADCGPISGRGEDTAAVADAVRQVGGGSRRSQRGTGTAIVMDIAESARSRARGPSQTGHSLDNEHPSSIAHEIAAFLPCPSPPQRPSTVEPEARVARLERLPAQRSGTIPR
jgi:hypothetical protein